MAEDLKAIGFDPANLQPDYSEVVFVDSLSVAARHLFPKFSREESFRELGRQFGDEYLKTVVGRVIAAGLPLIGPNRAISRIPRYASYGGSYFTADARMEEEGHWQVIFDGTSREMGPFTAGWIETGLRRTGIEPRVTNTDSGPDGYIIDVRW